MNCSLECDVHEYTPCSVVLDDVIQVIRGTSAVNLSYDRIDFLQVGYSCWIKMKNVWPCSASSFLEFLNATSFPVTSFLWSLRDSDSENCHDSWLLSVAASLPAINPPTCASFSLPWEPDAASGFEFLLALASGFPVDALSIPGRMRNSSRQSKPDSSLWASISPHFCPLLFVLTSSSPSMMGSWSSRNSASSKRSWNG